MDFVIAPRGRWGRGVRGYLSGGSDHAGRGEYVATWRVAIARGMLSSLPRRLGRHGWNAVSDPLGQQVP